MSYVNVVDMYTFTVTVYIVIYMTCMNCILTFLLVLTCDLLVDRYVHVDDLFLFVSLLYKTRKFHVAVHLISNR